jgi:hypothetical protein
MMYVTLNKQATAKYLLKDTPYTPYVDTELRARLAPSLALVARVPLGGGFEGGAAPFSEKPAPGGPRHCHHDPGTAIIVRVRLRPPDPHPRPIQRKMVCNWLADPCYGSLEDACDALLTQRELPDGSAVLLLSRGHDGVLRSAGVVRGGAIVPGTPAVAKLGEGCYRPLAATDEVAAREDACPAVRAFVDAHNAQRAELFARVREMEAAEAAHMSWAAAALAMR